METFIKQCWYMAGWAHEVGDAGLARRIANQPLFLFRLADGSIAAILDRCPHRFAPLSMGERDGDNVVCPYHGLTFSPGGKCVRNPYGDRIPAGTDIPAFTVVLRHGIAWLWNDPQGTPDPALIPDFSFLDPSPASRVLHGYTLMRANYQYGTDNLLDLTHIEFVHKGSFAGRGMIFRGQHSVRLDGTALHSDWFMPDVEVPSVAFGVYPLDARTDHWLEMRWNAPASMRLHIGACLHGEPRSAGFQLPQAHILTPASDGETHYFWASARYTDLADDHVDRVLLDMFAQAFDDEDKPIIEAAYANMEGAGFWESKPVSLGIDQGGTRARRLIEARLAAEANAS